MYKRAILYFSLLLILGSLHLVIPGSRGEDDSIALFARNSSSTIPEFDQSCLTAFFSTQDATGKHLKIRYNTDKPEPKPVSSQHYLREKIKGNADRGPKLALLVFSGEILDCIPQVSSFTGHLPFLLISLWTGNSTKIRPPPVF
jgi:hypothetical protein